MKLKAKQNKRNRSSVPYRVFRTNEEYEASLHAMRYDGGCGIILVDGKRCFVR